MKIAVVIPCFNVKKHVFPVINGIGKEVSKIYVVDDCCPQNSGEFIEKSNTDNRVQVLYHSENQGVGGAVCSGYHAALQDGMDIIVKIDGDGQMDPSLIPKFVKPIVNQVADYTKGSRFYSFNSLTAMPGIRKFGNSLLSFVNKVSSGYWNIMDPTNGYTAIHRRALSLVPLEKLSKGYFFESDMLFRLGTIRAVVRDIPMDAKYEDEESNLNTKKVAIEFPPLFIRSFFKRLFYNYFLRDFNGASMELVVGSIFVLFGVIFGSLKWTESIITDQVATTGTVMLSALPVILGFQLILSAINFDMNNIPTQPLSSYDW